VAGAATLHTVTNQETHNLNTHRRSNLKAYIKARVSINNETNSVTDLNPFRNLNTLFLFSEHP
jgi:hypothetical protein